MKIVIYSLLLFLLIPLINADQVVILAWQPNQTNVEYYTNKIDESEGKCPDSTENSYSSAQCHFNLSYYYMQLFREISLNIKDDKVPFDTITSRRQLLLLNKSNEHLLEVINISWSNLTVEDLKKNDKAGLLTSSLVFIAANYLDFKDYSNAKKYIELVDKILAIYPDSGKKKKIEEIIAKFHSLVPKIPKKVEVELIGDIYPMDFSQPEILPNIIFEPMESLESIQIQVLDQLHTEFFDQEGHQIYNIPNKDKFFTFDKKIILNKENSLFFPFFDKFSAEIFNIIPNNVQEKSLIISFKDEKPSLDGVAYFEKDNVKLIFKKKPFKIFQIAIFAFLVFLSLFYVNKRIKTMKTASFQIKKLKGWFPVASFFITSTGFIISSPGGIINFLNLSIIIYLIVTLRRFYVKRKRLYSDVI